jgi:hypothetical protein
LSGIKLGDDLHCGLGDGGEAMRCIGRHDDHIAGAAAPRLVADGDVGLAGQDAKDLFAVMEMNWSALGSAKPASGEDDAM